MKLIYFIWSLIERFGTNFVSLGGNIILSYLLMPEDFGLVAMLGVFSALIYVFIDCGLGDGLLTMGSPSDRDFNTVFYFNIAVAGMICLIYCGISPLMAWVFNRPEAQPMMCALGVGAIFCGLCISQMMRLRCELQFKKLAGLNVSAISLALAVAIYMALNGYRYWALIELQVGYNVFYWLLLAIFSRWHLKWEFDTAAFKRLWAFGVNLLLSTIVIQVAQNIFAFVIGKHINSTQAGYIGQAQKMQQTPNNSLEGSITSTAFVLIAQKDTIEQKRTASFEMFGVMTFVNSAFCFLLLALSYPLIDVIFPDKWLPTIPYFRLLLCWGLVYPVCNFMMVFFKIFDRTAVIRNIITIEKVLIIVSAFLLYPLGIEAMLIAAILLSFMSFFLYTHFAARLTLVPQWSYIRTYVANLGILGTCGAITFSVVTLLSAYSSLLALLSGIVIFAVAGAIVSKLFRPVYFSYAVNKLRGTLARQ